MIDRFSQFPGSLAQQARSVRLGPVPALLAHPDWVSPAPTVVWIHGRTANKELDPGRYLRYIRAGLGVCAIDLPAHGERADFERQASTDSPRIIGEAVEEIDAVVGHLGSSEFGGAFDVGRLGIGGMSLGGMVTLRRLCDLHSFRCAAVEATTGSLAHHYAGSSDFDAGKLAGVDPMQHLGGWRPIPLLATHSEADQIVPLGTMNVFLDALRAHYVERGADPALVQLVTWPETGAPQEHIGFGRFSNDAKNLQTAFFVKWLGSVGNI